MLSRCFPLKGNPDTGSSAEKVYFYSNVRLRHLTPAGSSTKDVFHHQSNLVVFFNCLHRKLSAVLVEKKIVHMTTLNLSWQVTDLVASGSRVRTRTTSKSNIHRVELCERKLSVKRPPVCHDEITHKYLIYATHKHGLIDKRISRLFHYLDRRRSYVITDVGF